MPGSIPSTLASFSPGRPNRRWACVWDADVSVSEISRRITDYSDEAAKVAANEEDVDKTGVAVVFDEEDEDEGSDWEVKDEDSEDEEEGDEDAEPMDTLENVCILILFFIPV